MWMANQSSIAWPYICLFRFEYPFQMTCRGWNIDMKYLADEAPSFLTTTNSNRITAFMLLQYNTAANIDKTHVSPFFGVPYNVQRKLPHFLRQPIIEYEQKVANTRHWSNWTAFLLWHSQNMRGMPFQY